MNTLSIIWRHHFLWTPHSVHLGYKQWDSCLMAWRNRCLECAPFPASRQVARGRVWSVRVMLWEVYWNIKWTIMSLQRFCRLLIPAAEFRLIGKMSRFAIVSDSVTHSLTQSVCRSRTRCQWVSDGRCRQPAASRRSNAMANVNDPCATCFCFCPLMGRVGSGRVIFFPTLVPGSGNFQLSRLAGLGYGLVRVLGSDNHNRFPNSNPNLNHKFTTLTVILP